MESNLYLVERELFLLGEILKGNQSISSLETEELPYSERTLRKASTGLKNKNIIEDEGRRGSKSKYKLKEGVKTSRIISKVFNFYKESENKERWQEFIGSPAASNLVEEIMPYLLELDGMEKGKIEAGHTKYPQVDLGEYSENEEILKILFNALNDDFFQYKMQWCPRCESKSCEHIEGFHIAREKYIREQIAQAKENKANREIQKRKYQDQ